MQDEVLALPMDVEDLGKLGRRKEVCPYYAARAAVPQADLVLLPYAALLLQASHAATATSCRCRKCSIVGHASVSTIEQEHQRCST